MKNIVFLRISLVLVGLLCSGGQANDIFPISDEVENIPNFTGLDKFDSEPIPPIFFDMTARLFESLVKLFDNLAVPNINIVKRTARNADTDRTKMPESITVTTEISNNVTESHTQPNINYLMISSSTPAINDQLINNNTKQNNDTYVNNCYNLSRILSTWPENSTIIKNSNQITRLVYIISAHTWNIYFMIKNNFSEQYNKMVKKLYTVVYNLLPRSFIASFVSGIRKYWLLRGTFADTIKEDVVLYVSLVFFCGMMLFVAIIVTRKLRNSQRKLKLRQEDVLCYVV